MAEADNTTELFDLIGLGFSSNKKEIVRPIVPAVRIYIDGEEIKVPGTPVRSTNSNGIVGYNIYETMYEIDSNTTEIPIVTATVDNEDVRVAITQAESMEGKAVVNFDYNGVIKTYNVIFAQKLSN